MLTHSRGGLVAEVLARVCATPDDQFEPFKDDPRFEIHLAALTELWSGTDLFALATWHEGYGMAVAEALKRGIPCALTAGGAVGALLPIDAGVIVPPGDWMALSRAMRRPIIDTALRHRMSDAAFAAGARLPGWDAQADAFARALAPVAG